MQHQFDFRPARVIFTMRAFPGKGLHRADGLVIPGGT